MPCVISVASSKRRRALINKLKLRAWERVCFGARVSALAQARIWPIARAWFARERGG